MGEKHLMKTVTHSWQPRPQGLLAFQNGGGSGEDRTQQITCLQRGFKMAATAKRVRRTGYGMWLAKGKINKMAEKAEVQFKKK